MKTESLTRQAAGVLARSFLLSPGRKLFETNKTNYNLPMSKLQKLMCGMYIILLDYADGLFPPTFEDQAKAYEAEVNLRDSMPGVTADEYEAAELRKPFWGAHLYRRYSGGFNRLLALWEAHQVQRGSLLLELGCGSGWMAEFLALVGYRVVGTTISPIDVALGAQRVESLKHKRITDRLSFEQAPMESVHQVVGAHGPFDGAFVFEALHHAFDWRSAILSASQCLKAGGVFIIANEPNLLHTFVSYRAARLTHTHEIGLSKSQLLRHLGQCGFSQLTVVQPKLNNWITTHWIVARKEDGA